jgi:hypothetical protein
MKKCPQCLNLFPDETQYCLNDGQPLISEVLPLPSEVGYGDEEETIIRHEPIVVDLSAMNAPPPAPPPVENVTIIRPVQPKSNVGKYLAFLIIGLLLGGALVLVTLLLTRSFYQNNDSNNAGTISNLNTNQARNNSTPKDDASPANKQPTINPEHQKKTDTSDDEFNGRVITLKAYVRSSPDRNSAQVDVLPINDRLTITSRENPNSPWFFVVCEHGVSGWMHGNTIEYTDK